MKIVIINDLVLYHLFLPTTVVLSITIFQYHNTRRVFLENIHLNGFVKVKIVGLEVFT